MLLFEQSMYLSAVSRRAKIFVHIAVLSASAAHKELYKNYVFTYTPSN